MADESIETEAASTAALKALLRRAERPTNQHVDALFDPRFPALSEAQRAFAFAAQDSLLRIVADDILSRLVETDVDIVDALDFENAQDFVRTPAMAHALLRRADEALLGAGLPDVMRLAGLGSEDTPLSIAMRSEDDDLSVRANAYFEISNARQTTLNEPMLFPDELATDAAEGLYWKMASLVSDAFDTVDLTSVEDAARRAIASRNIARSAQHLAMRLAARFVERGELSAALLGRTAASGDPLLVAALCAVRTGVTSSTAWALLFESGPINRRIFLSMTGIRPAEANGLAENFDQLDQTVDQSRGITRDTQMNFDDTLHSHLHAFWRLTPKFREVLSR
ncbi:MAG: hypothetical protein WA906_09010 [Pacificimonas sp.]